MMHPCVKMCISLILHVKFVIPFYHLSSFSSSMPFWWLPAGNIVWWMAVSKHFLVLNIHYHCKYISVSCTIPQVFKADFALKPPRCKWWWQEFNRMPHYSLTVSVCPSLYVNKFWPSVVLNLFHTLKEHRGWRRRKWPHSTRWVPTHTYLTAHL